jgi:nucleotide-binding universal stress UspA family protein
MIAVKRILVPHDFSETSNTAMKYGLELTRLFGAKLHVVHIGEKAQAEVEMEFPLGLDTSVEVAARERLLKILTPAEKKELNPEFVLRAGAPAAEIVRYAREEAIDLIVMGTHGRGFVAHAVIGSVAERVVRTAPCPVLTVGPPERELITSEAPATEVRKSD